MPAERLITRAKFVWGSVSRTSVASRRSGEPSSPRIATINALREQTGASLNDAVDVIDKLEAQKPDAAI